MNERRTRLAALVAGIIIAVVAGTVALAIALASWRAADPEVVTTRGVAQLEDGTPVLVLTATGSPETSAAARHDALVWTVTAVGLSVLPAIAIGWFLAGRLLRPVDAAVADVEAREAARENERRRRLDEVIHELRTPLAVAGTNLELAADDPALDPDTGRFVDAARRAAERMRRTVDDLAEHGQLSVAPTGAVDLSAEVRAVVSEHAGPARARSLQLESVERAGDPVIVPVTDASAIRTALGNLTDNAVRLAPGGSTVSVCCGVYRGWAWAAVIDEGPGLPANYHASVFERGWRGRHDRDRDRGKDNRQRGLGLTIARQLTEANGGLVTIDSAEGVGSTFAIWLPVVDDALATDVIAADHLHPAARPWRVQTGEPANA